jgi:hypothetical protein
VARSFGSLYCLSGQIPIGNPLLNLVYVASRNSKLLSAHVDKGLDGIDESGLGQRPSVERQEDENKRRWLEKEGQKNKKCSTDSDKLPHWQHGEATKLNRC